MELLGIGVDLHIQNVPRRQWVCAWGDFTIVRLFGQDELHHQLIAEFVVRISELEKQFGRQRYRRSRRVGDVEEGDRGGEDGPAGSDVDGFDLGLIVIRLSRLFFVDQTQQILTNLVCANLRLLKCRLNRNRWLR
jgi:hypothetical protein